MDRLTLKRLVKRRGNPVKGIEQFVIAVMRLPRLIPSLIDQLELSVFLLILNKKRAKLAMKEIITCFFLIKKNHINF
jgi:hypothetical protein